MKKLWLEAALLLLILALSMPTAQASEAETAYDGMDVRVQVEDGFLHFRLPTAYQYQPYAYDPSIEPYPFAYSFVNEAAGTRLTLYSTLDKEKDQRLGLRKLYDKSNSFTILAENLLIGEHAYLVYTQEGAAYTFGFLLLSGAGYSYRVQYDFLDEENRNEIPAEALAVLSTLEIEIMDE